MFGLPYMVDWRSSPQHSKSEIIGGDGVFPTFTGYLLLAWMQPDWTRFFCRRCNLGGACTLHAATIVLKILNGSCFHATSNHYNLFLISHRQT
jgi:hypothetical protein